ncbi:D-alanyl-D-alanine carboxypeptidase PBP3 [Streptococcus pluranimalium]|uniref:serine-type D-Ala-D-Ala carboxypeptidase n=1 Tax=Streptococcus pluranimalium TaxID=82348 RepID=A0A345VHP4_9STRE|nr:D-alanyl-D-alanine carboxypeptidase PBP3 [Streptococcus pluranimalium]AXJ12246.1 D-alanyl-D-alanine carboxypeptidase DacA [Streptococcus pluranimalium]
MKKIIVLFSFIICFQTTITKSDHFEAKAEHAIAVEANTGKILYEKDATTPDAIASITKILTVYMVYQEIDKGNLTWDTEIDISDYPYHLTVNPEASNVPMEARKYTVRDLVNAAMVASANSAAIALAEHIGGSEPKFVDMMSQQLKDWGIKDAKLVNASGLNNEVLGDNIYPGSKKTDENMMSAKDVAIIAQHLINDFPDVLNYSKKTSKNFDGVEMITSNKLLLEKENPYGIDGLKTGTTELAGASIVSTSNKNNMRVISVILNADNGTEIDNARFDATKDLLNYIYNHFDFVKAISKNQTYQDKSVRISSSILKNISPIANSDFYIVKPKNEEYVNFSFNPQKTSINAPIKKGQNLATITFQDNYKIGDGYLSHPPSIAMVSPQDIDKNTIIEISIFHMKQVFNNIKLKYHHIQEEYFK